ncbi:MAG: signal peptidase II [Ignavibacteria bacterium]|nr:MAG: signal peptidase II [Ignavibacteria bacterium]
MRVLYLTLGVIFVDQFSKFYIKGINIPFLNISFDGMYYGESISVIGDFFRITFIENPGMAFGFNPGSDFKLWISVFSLIASIGLIVYLYVVRNKSLSLRIALALILGGAVGNLIDRTFYGIIYKYAPAFYGKVVDFFDFDFFNFAIFGRSYDRWPIFNIADASVTIGVLILILFYRQHQKEDEENFEQESVKDEKLLQELNGVENNYTSKDNEVNERTENNETDETSMKNNL